MNSVSAAGTRFPSPTAGDTGCASALFSIRILRGKLLSRFPASPCPAMISIKSLFMIALSFCFRSAVPANSRSVAAAVEMAPGPGPDHLRLRDTPHPLWSARTRFQFPENARTRLGDDDPL
jgi:hypothetical protein